MSNSSLVDYLKISPNKTSPRTHDVDTITIHCVVGQLSVEKIGEIFASSGRNASSNYGIGSDGRIGLYVDEKDRSWCSSNASNDNRAITIECASDKSDPYSINSDVYKSLIKLCVDICERNGIDELKWKADHSLIGQIDKQNMTVHRWFANKSCPGDYIYSRLGKIADEVNINLEKNRTKTGDHKTVTEGGCNVELKTLKQGDKGKRVRALQTLLIGYGYKCGSSGIDGNFGPKTDSALKLYQKVMKLSIDGIAGKETWSSLLGIK